MSLLLKLQTYLGLAFLFIIVLGPFLTKGICNPLVQRDNVPRNRQQYIIELNHSEALQEGRLTIGVYLSNVKDLCIWQTKLVYDPCLLVILNIEASDFMSTKTVVINSTRLFYNNEPIESYISTNALNEYAVIVFATDVAPGVLLIGGCNLNLHTISGSGKVATITFGVCKPSDYAIVSLEESLLLDEDFMESAEGSITIVR